MQEAQHPNRLRLLLAVAGLNQREAAREAYIPEGTFRHYVAGEQVIPKRDRIKLAQVIGCDIQDLAPQYDIQGGVPKKLASRSAMTDTKMKAESSFEERDGCFSFGRLKTSAMVLDGDGTEVYLPTNIHTYYDPQPATFFEEIEYAKKDIQQEQEENKIHGRPYQWNFLIEKWKMWI